MCSRGAGRKRTAAARRKLGWPLSLEITSDALHGSPGSHQRATRRTDCAAFSGTSYIRDTSLRACTCTLLSFAVSIRKVLRRARCLCCARNNCVLGPAALAAAPRASREVAGSRERRRGGRRRGGRRGRLTGGTRSAAALRVVAADAFGRRRRGRAPAPWRASRSASIEYSSCSGSAMRKGALANTARFLCSTYCHSPRTVSSASGLGTYESAPRRMHRASRSILASDEIITTAARGPRICRTCGSTSTPERSGMKMSRTTRSKVRSSTILRSASSALPTTSVSKRTGVPWITFDRFAAAKRFASTARCISSSSTTRTLSETFRSASRSRSASRPPRLRRRRRAPA